MRTWLSAAILLIASLILTACAAPEVALVSTATPFPPLPSIGVTLVSVATPLPPKPTLAPAGTYSSIIPPGRFAGPLTECIDQRIGGEARNEIQQGMRLPTAAEEGAIRSCLATGTPSPRPTASPRPTSPPPPPTGQGQFIPQPQTDSQRQCIDQKIGAEVRQTILDRKREPSDVELNAFYACVPPPPTPRQGQLPPPKPTPLPGQEPPQIALLLNDSQRACVDRIIGAQSRAEVEKASRPRTPLEDTAMYICQSPTTSEFVPPAGATPGVFPFAPIGFDSARVGCIKNTLGIQATTEIALGYRQPTAVEDKALWFCNSYSNAGFVPSPGLTFGKYEPVLPRFMSASGGDCIARKISTQAYGEFFLGYRLPTSAEEGIVQYCKGLIIGISELVSPNFDPARRECIESRIGTQATQDIGNWIRDPTPNERYIIAMCQCNGLLVTNYFGVDVIFTIADAQRGVDKNGGILCFRIDAPGRYPFSYSGIGIRKECGKYNDCTVEIDPKQFNRIDLW